MAASIFNGNAVKILKNILRFQDGTELSAIDAGYVSGLSANVQDQLNDKINTSDKGVANGVAELDSGGKVPASQLPNSIMEYLGTWAASTNTPTLTNGTGNAGDVYIASDAGTVNFGAGNITFAAGDWVIYSGSVWQKSINSNAVASVNGFTGAVTLDTDDISEGTAQYFTDERAQDAVGGILANTGTVELSYNDGLNQISASVPDGGISNVKLASGIDAIKIADGTVSNAEFQYLGGVTSDLQTQINGKEPSITTLAVNKGGTGQTTYTDGQLLIGNSTGNTLTKATLTAGTDISITNGNGSISIASTAATPSYTYTAQSSTYSASIGNYIVASGASFTITLPTAVGNAGKSIIIEHGGTSLSQKYTLNTTSSQTIGGVASGSYVLCTAGEVLHVVSNGTNWQIASHRAVTGWASYTPTFGAGFGTVSTFSFYWRRNGQDIEIYGNWVNGTVAASATTVTLPTGALLATSLLNDAQTQKFGEYHFTTGTATSVPSTSTGPWAMIYVSGNNDSLSVAETVDQVGNAIYVLALGNGIAGNGNRSTISNLKVPISDWQP